MNLESGTVLLGLLGSAAAAAAGWFGWRLLLYMAGLFLTPPNVSLENPGALQDPSGDNPRFTSEEVSFMSRDGAVLWGTHVRGPWPPRRTVLFCHESDGDSRSWIRFVPWLLDEGFDLFTFDFRGCGRSRSPVNHQVRSWVTEAEVQDVSAALDFLIQERSVPPGRLAVVAVSRGAAAAVVEMSRRRYAGPLVCEGLSSTLGTMRRTMRRWARIYVPRRVIDALPEALFGGAARIVLWTSEIREAVRFPLIEEYLPALRTTPPLFIYGARDTYTPREQAECLAHLAGSREEQGRLLFFPGARHKGSRDSDPERHRAAILECLR